MRYRYNNNGRDNNCSKNNLQQSVWSLGVLEDKKRLIRGESTETIDVTILKTNIEQRQKRLDELRKIVDVPFKLETPGKVGNGVCIAT